MKLYWPSFARFLFVGIGGTTELLLEQGIEVRNVSITYRVSSFGDVGLAILC